MTVIVRVDPVTGLEVAERIIDRPADPPPMGITDPRSLDVRFAAWMKTDEGQEVVRMIREANEPIRRRGFEHYSIGGLAHVVRWHHHKIHGPDAAGFKVNSVYMSRLARWLLDCYPDEFPPGYFETRRLRS